MSRRALLYLITMASSSDKMQYFFFFEQTLNSWGAKLVSKTNSMSDPMLDDACLQE